MQRDASIEDQARLCIERAAKEGWTVTQTFSDMAISGTLMQRPGLQSLLDHAEHGKIDVVVSEALDRLSRDQADVATLFKRLSFHGVRIVTLAEGEVSELHVGLKGTMNQLFLKDVADKTRRGLRGRVEAGHSGGGKAYGYDVVRQLGPDGMPVTGERVINEGEAEIVRRIFGTFATGQSPKAIAREFNAEGIPGPRGKLWRDTAIRGHRQRGTGILNNELYVGRLVWNRMRYVKDPSTGKRVSRLNAREDWILTEVPELRIIDDALWDRVKERQEKIDASSRVQGIKASRFWEHRRKTHLLTGLLRCGRCGGGFASVGKDYLACSAARKLGTCDQRRGFKRDFMETAVLDLLQDRLMQPDAVAAFVKSFNEEINRQRGAETNERSRLEAEFTDVQRKLDGLYDAIADGLRTPGLKERLEEMESRKAAIEEKLSSPTPSPVRLHPSLSDLYRKKVMDLSASLANPDIRTQALENIRALIDCVTVHDAEGDGVTLELEGALAAMIDAAQPDALKEIDHSSVKVVAGDQLEPENHCL
jgi:DNA invertase Pin-like site-specific DNA recombinase